MKKIAFFDIDGTLWDNKNFIPPSTIEAIRAFRKNGGLAFINSGRARAYIVNPDLLGIGFDGLVCGCGTHIELNEKILYQHLLSQDEVNYTTKIVRQNQFRPIYEGPNHLYLDEEEFPVGEPFGDKIRREISDTLLTITGQNEIEANKLSCAIDTPDPNTCFRQLGHLYTFIIHTSTVVEMVPKGHSKATGIQKVCELLGADIKDTYAFGDSENDLEMLKAAGHSIVMGNGTERAKAVANYVTDDLYSDGIYNAMKYYSLI